jgi:hypothetical protein
VPQPRKRLCEDPEMGSRLRAAADQRERPAFGTSEVGRADGAHGRGAQERHLIPVENGDGSGGDEVANDDEGMDVRQAAPGILGCDAHPLRDGDWWILGGGAERLEKMAGVDLEGELRFDEDLAFGGRRNAWTTASRNSPYERPMASTSALDR